MTLQAGGAISLSQIQTEMGGTTPISMSEYIKGGAYTTASMTNSTVPRTTTNMAMSNFYNTAKTPIDITGGVDSYGQILDIESIGTTSPIKIERLNDVYSLLVYFKENVGVRAVVVQTHISNYSTSLSTIQTISPVLDFVIAPDSISICVIDNGTYQHATIILSYVGISKIIPISISSGVMTVGSTTNISDPTDFYTGPSYRRRGVLLTSDSQFAYIAITRSTYDQNYLKMATRIVKIDHSTNSYNTVGTELNMITVGSPGSDGNQMLDITRDLFSGNLILATNDAYETVTFYRISYNTSTLILTAGTSTIMFAGSSYKFTKTYNTMLPSICVSYGAPYQESIAIYRINSDNTIYGAGTVVINTPLDVGKYSSVMLSSSGSLIYTNDSVRFAYKPSSNNPAIPWTMNPTLTLGAVDNSDICLIGDIYVSSRYDSLLAYSVGGNLKLKYIVEIAI